VRRRPRSSHSGHYRAFRDALAARAWRLDNSAARLTETARNLVALFSFKAHVYPP
jgi:hypothetical protein